MADDEETLRDAARARGGRARSREPISLRGAASLRRGSRAGVRGLGGSAVCSSAARGFPPIPRRARRARQKKRALLFLRLHGGYRRALHVSLFWRKQRGDPLGHGRRVARPRRSARRGPGPVAARRRRGRCTPPRRTTRGRAVRVASARGGGEAPPGARGHRRARGPARRRRRRPSPGENSFRVVFCEPPLRVRRGRSGRWGSRSPRCRGKIP